MLAREQAFALVRQNISKKNVIYHVVAVEAIMKALARNFGEDEEKWGLTGLLHDVDYEKTESTPERHSLLAETILKGQVEPEIIKAIKTHNFEHTGVKPEIKMEMALVAADAVSGLLIACALVMPSKKLADVRVESVNKKFRDKDFARGADRDRMLYCERLGLSKERFFEISLNGLKEYASEIGL